MTQNTHSFFDNSMLEVDVLTEQAWADKLPFAEELARECALETIKKTAPQLLQENEVEITISLSSDQRVHELNKQYREKDRPTNVLSFANYQELRAERQGDFEKGMPILLGDVILALGVVIKEAEEQNKKLEHHFAHLLVHGCLHLLGYDHIEKHEAQEMELLEVDILFNLGIKNPYNTVVEQSTHSERAK